MTVSSETLQTLSQMLYSPTSEYNLPAGMETELLLVGAVVTLQQDASEEAIQILREASFSCPIEAAKIQALAALELLAGRGNEKALRVLFDLAIDLNFTPARNVITSRDFKIIDQPRQAAFDLLAGRVDRYRTIDPHFTQLTRFFLEKASTDLQERLLAAAAKGGMGNWVLLISAARDHTPEAMETFVERFSAFQPIEHKLAIHLLANLASGGEQAAQEALCQLFIRYEERQAGEIAVKNNYTPRDSIQRALFYFVSEQWQKYAVFDFDHRLLVAAYEIADNTMRKRLLDLSRQSGQLEWFNVLSGMNRLRWLGDLSDADWETAIHQLTNAGRWEELWRLALLSAPHWSAQIIQALTVSGWQPASEEDRQELAHLSDLSREALANPLTIRQHRAFALPTVDDLTSMALSPDGKTLAVGNSGNAIFLWQVGETPAPLPALHGAVAQTRSLAFSSDGEYLVSSVGDNSLRIYRWQDGKAVKTLEGHGGLVRSLVISPDSRSLYTASFDGTVRSWRFPFGPEHKIIAQSEGEYFGVALGPDGNTLIAAGADPALQVFDLPEGNKVRELKGHSATVTNLAAASTTQFVASYSRDRTIRIWNYTSGREIRFIDYTQDVVTGLCIHPNEQVLVSAGYRGKINLWSMSTGVSLYELSHHKRAVIGLALSPDGEQLISASADGSVNIWNLSIFLLSRQPVETMRPDRLPEIQKKLADKAHTHQENKWLELTLELLHWKQRFDVEIEGGPKTISLGEFDIQL